jgi:hypothetical protein
METREWLGVVDKASWGPGPWQDEPDKMQWPDPATGSPCLLVRSQTTGAWCGYVGVMPGHPAYGLHYDGTTTEDAERRIDHIRTVMRRGAELAGHEARAQAYAELPGDDDPVVCGALREVAVHGGLTFAGGCQPGDPARGICHVPAAGEPDQVWWLGFDAGHYRDSAPAIRALLRDLPPVLPALDQWVHADEVYRDVAYMQAECASLASQLELIRHGLLPVGASAEETTC